MPQRGPKTYLNLKLYMSVFYYAMTADSVFFYLKIDEHPICWRATRDKINPALFNAIYLSL